MWRKREFYDNVDNVSPVLSVEYHKRFLEVL